MIITQPMLPKTLLQGSWGDLSLQVWLLTSSGYCTSHGYQSGGDSQGPNYFSSGNERYIQLGTVQGDS